MKLTDEPSMALLEMTFDLTTWDNLRTTIDQEDFLVKKEKRSKSVVSGRFSRFWKDRFRFLTSLRLNDCSRDQTQKCQEVKFLYVKIAPINNLKRRDQTCVSPLQTTNLSFILVDGAPSVGFRRFPYRRLLSPTRALDSHSSKTAPCSPRAMPKKEQCRDSSYQRATTRAMVLSPLGNNLTSWWCSRRQTCEETIEHRKQSLAGVMSVLSGRIKGIGRRCISLPDMSRISALFEQAEDGEEKSKPESPASRFSRPGTIDDEHFYITSKNTIIEENESDLAKTNFSCPSAAKRHTNELLSYDIASRTDLDVEKTISNHDVNDKAAKHKSTYKDNAVSSKSLSSSSSEGSPRSFAATLQNGEQTRQRRFSKDRSKHKLTQSYRRDSNDLLPGTFSSKSNNRDSGYEEASSPDDHFHVTMTSPGLETTHLLAYKIPEERTSPTPFCN